MLLIGTVQNEWVSYQNWCQANGLIPQWKQFIYINTRSTL